MIKEIHSNVFCTREDFMKKCAEEFDELLSTEDFLNFEKAIMTLMSGDLEMFFTFCVNELAFWWMPTHLLHLYFIYQSIDGDILTNFESVIIKHLETIISMKNSFWRIAVMLTNELLNDREQIIRNILSIARIDTISDFED